jgi:hypothetical protein
MYTRALYKKKGKKVCKPSEEKVRKRQQVDGENKQERGVRTGKV